MHHQGASPECFQQALLRVKNTSEILENVISATCSGVGTARLSQRQRYLHYYEGCKGKYAHPGCQDKYRCLHNACTGSHSKYRPGL